MKPINEMSLKEVQKRLHEFAFILEEPEFASLADRIHELTRWIPVEERLPTEEDENENGDVLAYSPSPHITHISMTASSIPLTDHFTHWRRIDRPEGV